MSLAIGMTACILVQLATGFAYRVGMPWWAFVMAGVLAAVVALCTVSFQAEKAAMTNPVKSLRTE